MVSPAFEFDNPLTTPQHSPIFRWAGGKRRLLQHIFPLIPKRASRYYEPFFGGGALFFALAPLGERSILADLNPELINAYEQIRKSPDEFISVLKTYDYDHVTYTHFKQSEPDDNFERAIRFTYLNRTCWNGLYRVNHQGKFNVPMGKSTLNKVNICEDEKIRDVSKALKNVRLSSSDFSTVLKYIRRDDFVYLDPPYISGHENNGFRHYNERVFEWDDQVRLSKIANALSKRGVKVMISNSAYPDIIELFDGFYVKKIQRNSIISGQLSGRHLVSEVILTSYPVPTNDETEAS